VNRINKVQIKDLKTFFDNIIIQQHEMIDYISIFQLDGTLIYCCDNAKNVNFIKNLIGNDYLVIFNFRNKKVLINRVLIN